MTMVRVQRFYVRSSWSEVGWSLMKMNKRIMIGISGGGHRRFRNCDYDNIYPWQRLNHYPKSTGITKKDCLARNLKRMKGVHGAGVYNFSPISFNLPNDYTRFVAEYSKNKQNENKNLLWICKPADQSRGRGIFIFRDISSLQYDCTAVLQKYITNPLLIGGYKFDVRIYVAVPSFHPLTVYVYQEGIVRFGTEKFDLNALNNVFAHLTNTSINKHGPAYTLDKERIGAGCKWTITQLRYYFHQNHIDDNILWIRIVNIIVLTLLIQAPQVPKFHNCFELYGFDILIDENLKPWLLEVNFSPALSSDCQTDLIVKKPLLHDVMDLMNFKEADKDRGINILGQMTSRRKAPDTDRYSSVSRTGRNSALNRSAANFQKSMTNLSKQPSIVQESTSYIEQEMECHKIKDEEKMCYGLPLVNPADDDKRPSSASSGVSSANSEKLDTVDSDLETSRCKSAAPKSSRKMRRESSRVSLTSLNRKRDGVSSARGRMTPIDVNNNQPVKQAVVHTSVGPIKTSIERQTTTLSSIERAQRAEKQSIKSSSTTDSAISSYAGSGSENSDLISLPEDSRTQFSGKLVSNKRRTSYTYGQTVMETAVPTLPVTQSANNIKSLRPNGNSNALRKISSLGNITPAPAPFPARSQSRMTQGRVINGSISSRETTRMKYQSAAGLPTGRASRARVSMPDKLPVNPRESMSSPKHQTPSLRRNNQTNKESGTASRRGFNTSRFNSKSRLQTLSQLDKPKIKGPPSRIGDFYLVFPFNETSYRTANASLDPHIVIKECQKLLREALHAEKSTSEKRMGGHLPFGAKEDTERERLWPPVKPPPAEES
ncbi:hypothetical protein FSP39_002748 [Pinctada imbricata]|uniref:Tubulin polyglutamylase TTLL2 n=1 Tax=Pinctada imbricata TaxID=66713 RepID=A0AA88Y8P8_PINIB|nr:hypothetical protein FSP39_002748 [Pinctada imbricata]